MTHLNDRVSIPLVIFVTEADASLLQSDKLSRRQYFQVRQVLGLHGKEPEMETTTQAVLLCLLSVVIVVANGSVCLLVYKRVDLRSFTNGFVVSLALSDILTGAVLMPLYLVLPSFAGTYYLNSIILLAGVANVCAVTYDRYFAITIPLRYYEHINRHFTGIIATSWLLPIVISLLPIAWEADSSYILHKVYLFLLQFLGVVIPYIFVFIAYFRIFQQVRSCVRRHMKVQRVSTGTAQKMAEASAEAKVARVFAIVAVTFILCWLPVLFMTSVAALERYDLIPGTLERVSIFTVAFGSLINPLLYSFMKPDFKKVVRAFFRSRKDNCFLSSQSRNTLLESRNSVVETAI